MFLHPRAISCSKTRSRGSEIGYRACLAAPVVSGEPGLRHSIARLARGSLKASGSCRKLLGKAGFASIGPSNRVESPPLSAPPRYP